MFLHVFCCCCSLSIKHFMLMWWPKWKSEEPATGLPMRWCYWDIRFTVTNSFVYLYVVRNANAIKVWIWIGRVRSICRRKRRKKTECNRMLLSDLILIMNKLNCEDEEETRRKQREPCGSVAALWKETEWNNIQICLRSHAIQHIRSLSVALGYTLFHLVFL